MKNIKFKMAIGAALFSAFASLAGVVKSPLSDPSAGYVIRGIGRGNEVAVVFTNHTKSAVWRVPCDLRNVSFLVVAGGGGGGGAVNTTGGGAGGAGGGGGCVVTGVVNSLAKNSVVGVTVGVGGKGGLYSSGSAAGAGKACHGSNTVFKVDDVVYVTAFGGGGDLGYRKNSGVNGGSNSGARLADATASSAVDAKAVWDESALSGVLSNVEALRQRGGYNSLEKFSSSGGGGGATGVGGDPGSSAYGGRGGAGLLSDIAGDYVTYGSGGGGGTARGASAGGYDREGGEGAGEGKWSGDGDPAMPNQGGGGGGAGFGGNGGAGGSGVVILRYTDTRVGMSYIFTR